MNDMEKSYDLTPIYGGRTLRTHPAAKCADDETCAIHKPSAHRLTWAPLHWRGDRGLLERICEHGVGHPDPDDLAFKKKTMPNYDSYAFEVHGCDGCCG